MNVTIKRRSAQPKPPRMAKPKPKPRAKWDEKAKRRIIDHFKRELSISHGVKR